HEDGLHTQRNRRGGSNFLNQHRYHGADQGHAQPRQRPWRTSSPGWPGHRRARVSAWASLSSLGATWARQHWPLPLLAWTAVHQAPPAWAASTAGCAFDPETTTTPTTCFSLLPFCLGVEHPCRGCSR